MDLPVMDAEQAECYLNNLLEWSFLRACDLAGVSPQDVPPPSCHSGHDPAKNPSDLRLPGCPPVRWERCFSSVGIVGAGLMGATIAAQNLARGFSVTLCDAYPEVLASAPQRIAKELTAIIAEADAVATWTTRLHCEIHLAALSACDCILEAVPESLPTKQSVFHELEANVSTETPLFTNTSSIPVARLAQGLKAPWRLCGLHFLHPVRERRIVELIPHTGTSESTSRLAARYALQLGKIPLQVQDRAGFLVNRLLFAYLSEGLRLLSPGHSPEEIDRSAASLGFLIGPFRIMDEIGLDTAWAVGKILWEAFPDRVEPSPILVALLKRKRLGRKAGAGFYRYDSPDPWASPGVPDVEVQSLINSWRGATGDDFGHSLEERLCLAMMFEGLRAWQEKIVEDHRAIDLAAVMGLGFPRQYGGPVSLALRLGHERLRDLLRQFQPVSISEDLLEGMLRSLTSSTGA